MSSERLGVPVPWRDLRDGQPPEAFFLWVRSMMERAYAVLVPPLHPIDLLMLMGQGLASRYFYPIVPRGGPPRMDLYGYLDIRGVHTILVAWRDYADKANILWAPKAEDQIDTVMFELSTWMTEVQKPAHGGPWCGTQDTSPRGLEIKRQTELIFRGAFTPDYTSMIRGLDRVVTSNVGGNEWNIHSRAELSPAERREWFKFMAEQAGFSMDGFILTEGGLRYDVAGAGAQLNKSVPRGIALDHNILSLDAPSIDAKTNRKSTAVGNLAPDRRVTSPAEAIELAGLRDLRDAHDLARNHPLLDRMADAAGPRAAGEVVSLLSGLLPILEAAEDTAMAAAIVYELGASNGAGWGAWSRAEVAESYGVSVRQLETRAKRAAPVVRRLLAA